MTKIEEEIPELKERDIRNVRLKKLTAQLAEVVSGLGASLRKEITIVATNRSHLLTMTKVELSKTEPEILVEALEVVCKSLLEAVKQHRPSYEKILKLTSKKEVAEHQLADCQSRLAKELQISEDRCKFLETKTEQATSILKERENKIRVLEQEAEALRMRIIRLEREVDHSYVPKGETTHKSMSAFDRMTDVRELYELKKIINEEKSDMNVVAGKNRQITSLKIINKKQDQQIIKGRFSSG